MKYLLFAAFLQVFIVDAMAQKKKEVAYELPAAMSPEVKAGYEQICDKGNILYDLNCAKCHNTKVGRKSIIPDFSPEQLVGYELRITNPQHEGSISETSVTVEELGQIMTFLSYKKKNVYKKNKVL